MLNLRELFSRPTEIKTDYLGTILIHYLRNPTPDEDLQYRKRSANVRVTSGQVETSTTALAAPVWLYDLIAEHVTMQNDEDGTEEEVEGFKELVPSDLKAAIIAAWQNRFGVIDKGVRAKPKGETET